MLGLEHAPFHLAIECGKYLTHRGIANPDVTAPFEAVVENRRAAALERRTVGIAAVDVDLEGAIALSAAEGHLAAHVTLAQHMATKGPAPHQHLGLGPCFLPVGPGRIVQREALGQLRHHFVQGDL
ncbi:hypothetical protein D3C81_1097770 [compost metagenome]